MFRINASLLFLNACTLEKLNAWVPLSSSGSRNSRSTFSSPAKRFMVESLSLDSLGENHEDVGQELADSLRRMLDAEWMPQEVHVRMAASVKKSYVSCREAGEADLMAIMTVTADDLTVNWKDYDKDAFVNAWDISNYVSDFLAAKTGGQGCDCNQKIY